MNPRTPERQDHPLFDLKSCMSKSKLLTLARLDYSSKRVKICERFNSLEEFWPE